MIGFFVKLARRSYKLIYFPRRKRFINKKAHGENSRKTEIQSF